MHLSFLKKKKKSGMELSQWHCRNKMEKKNFAIGLWQCHCRNRWEFFFFLAIVAITLPKMGRRKKVISKIWGGIKKKILHPQYFYNIFTINHR